MTRCSEIILSRRLEWAPDLADVHIRESGAAVEGDSKSRRNVSSVGANDHKQPLTCTTMATADANDELKAINVTQTSLATTHQSRLLTLLIDSVSTATSLTATSVSLLSQPSAIQANHTSCLPTTLLARPTSADPSLPARVVSTRCIYFTLASVNVRYAMNA